MTTDASLFWVSVHVLKNGTKKKQVIQQTKQIFMPNAVHNWK